MKTPKYLISLAAILAFIFQAFPFIFEMLIMSDQKYGPLASGESFLLMIICWPIGIFFAIMNSFQLVEKTRINLLTKWDFLSLALGWSIPFTFGGYITWVNF